MRFVLDTSVLISPRRVPEDDEYAISAVSLAELHFGVLKATGTPALPSRLQRLSEVESAFEPIPFDTRIARASAHVRMPIWRRVKTRWQPNVR